MHFLFLNFWKVGLWSIYLHFNDIEEESKNVVDKNEIDFSSAISGMLTARQMWGMIKFIYRQYEVSAGVDSMSQLDLGQALNQKFPSSFCELQGQQKCLRDISYIYFSATISKWNVSHCFLPSRRRLSSPTYTYMSRQKTSYIG